MLAGRGSSRPRISRSSIALEVVAYSRCMEYLTIGELAKRAGVATSALRFYESRGLIVSTRTAGNQRRYPRATLRRVALIRAGQEVGLSLGEVAAALETLPHDRVPGKRDWEATVRFLAGPSRRADRRAPGATRRAQRLHRLRLSLTPLLRHLRSFRSRFGEGYGPRYLLGDERSAAD
jgi:redox-sensitive transcriptional activator SoxR